MQTPQCSAPGMKRDSGWHVNSCKSRCGTANAEVNILQIGFEFLIQQPNSLEQFLAKNGCRERGKPDLAGLVPKPGIGAAMPASPGAGATANSVEGTLDATGVGNVQ